MYKYIEPDNSPATVAVVAAAAAPSIGLILYAVFQ